MGCYVYRKREEKEYKEGIKERREGCMIFLKKFYWFFLKEIEIFGIFCFFSPGNVDEDDDGIDECDDEEVWGRRRKRKLIRCYWLTVKSHRRA